MEESAKVVLDCNYAEVADVVDVTSDGKKSDCDDQGGGGGQVTNERPNVPAAIDFWGGETVNEDAAAAASLTDMMTVEVTEPFDLPNFDEVLAEPPLAMPAQQPQERPQPPRDEVRPHAEQSQASLELVVCEDGSLALLASSAEEGEQMLNSLLQYQRGHQTYGEGEQRALS
jgi:hypothetical protein